MRRMLTPLQRGSIHNAMAPQEHRRHDGSSTGAERAVTGLTERQQSILGAAVREYVATAAPVASGDLVRKYQLPYSAATVRNEFLELDRAGYLTQPHTSAGRVPTDRGYRFFINRELKADGEERVGPRETEALREIRSLGDPVEFVRQSSRILAELTHNFVLTGFPQDELFYKAGLAEVMEEPEFKNLECVHEFTRLAEAIEDEIQNAFASLEFDEPQTFIGSENPIRQARRYGMIVSSCGTPFAKQSVIALVGPKRMDYGHHVAVLREFRELLGA